MDDVSLWCKEGQILTRQTTCKKKCKRNPYVLYQTIKNWGWSNIDGNCTFPVQIYELKAFFSLPPPIPYEIYIHITFFYVFYNLNSVTYHSHVKWSKMNNNKSLSLVNSEVHPLIFTIKSAGPLRAFFITKSRSWWMR